MYEADANKVKRLEEEKNSLKRKLDRAKKMEKFENIDQVLQEENRILRVIFFLLSSRDVAGEEEFPSPRFFFSCLLSLFCRRQKIPSPQTSSIARGKPHLPKSGKVKKINGRPFCLFRFPHAFAPDPLGWLCPCLHQPNKLRIIINFFEF